MMHVLCFYSTLSSPLASMTLARMHESDDDLPILLLSSREEWRKGCGGQRPPCGRAQASTPGQTCSRPKKPTRAQTSKPRTTPEFGESSEPPLRTSVCKAPFLSLSKSPKSPPPESESPERDVDQSPIADDQANDRITPEVHIRVLGANLQAAVRTPSAPDCRPPSVRRAPFMKQTSQIDPMSEFWSGHGRTHQYASCLSRPQRQQNRTWRRVSPEAEKTCATTRTTGAKQEAPTPLCRKRGRRRKAGKTLRWRGGRLGESSQRRHNVLLMPRAQPRALPPKRAIELTNELSRDLGRDPPRLH